MNLFEPVTLAERVEGCTRSFYINIDEYCSQNRLKPEKFNEIINSIRKLRVVIFNSEKPLIVTAYQDSKTKVQKKRITTAEHTVVYCLTQKDFVKMIEDVPLTLRIKSSKWFRDNIKSIEEVLP